MTDYTKRSIFAKLITEADIGRITEPAWLAVEASVSTVAWSPSGNGNAKTWKDVQAILANTTVPLSIHLIDVDFATPVFYDIPPGITDLKNSVFFVQAGNPGQAVLRFADGAQLRNGGFNGLVSGLFNGNMSVLFQSTIGSPNPLAWDSQDLYRFANFGFGSGAAIQNVGTIPAIQVPQAAPDSLMIFVFANTSDIIPGTAPIISMDVGSAMIVVVLNNGAGFIDPGWISAGATNLVIMLADGFDLGTVPTWAGAAFATFINNPISIDGGSGPSFLRPFGAFFPLVVGTRYFDISILPPRPIYWDGAMFVDALGIGPV